MYLNSPEYTRLLSEQRHKDLIREAKQHRLAVEATRANDKSAPKGLIVFSSLFKGLRSLGHGLSAIFSPKFSGERAKNRIRETAEIAVQALHMTPETARRQKQLLQMYERIAQGNALADVEAAGEQMRA